MTSTQGSTPGRRRQRRLLAPGRRRDPTRPGRRSARVSNYNRMTTTFPGAAARPAPSNWKQQPDGNWWSWDGSTWHLQPQGPPAAPPTPVDAPGSPLTVP